MRSFVTLAAATGLAFAAVPAAATHPEHYEQAMQCYLVTTFIGGIYREGKNDLPDNKASSESLAAPYMPVLAYEGTHMGMKSDEILTDISHRYGDFQRTKLAELNASADAAQTKIFNELVERANACGGIPTFSRTAE